MQVRFPGRGNYVSSARLGLVSGLRYLFENGNSKKFSHYFLSKYGFRKLSWLSVDFALHALEIFWDFRLKEDVRGQVRVLIE